MAIQGHKKGFLRRQILQPGLKEQEAMSMIVCGFMEPFTKELPLEYAVELNRLIQLEMIGAIG